MTAGSDDLPAFDTIPGFTDEHGTFPKMIVTRPRWSHSVVECPDGCQRVHLVVPASVWRCACCDRTHEGAATRVEP